MTLQIRPASASDADTLLSLINALADYERLERPDPGARARLIRDGFEGPARFRAYIAELNGGAIGYAITYHTYSSFLALPTLYLEDLFILPDARRLGVGRAMFEYLAGEALRQGCGRMEWVVLDWNDPAIDFYEALGAKRLSEWLPYRLTREQLETIGTSP
jgi:GNAT superfamily N-acetyltransferase